MRTPSIFGLLLACTTTLTAQGKPLTVFSYDQPNPHTVPLPTAIRILLAHDPNVIARHSGDNPPPPFSDDWVLCYRISLGPAHETDYLIQANPQLGGANVTPFWVFRMIAGQPKQVLFTGGLALEITSKKLNGLYEVRSSAVTMQRPSTVVYRFDGAQYVQRAPTTVSPPADR